MDFHGDKWLQYCFLVLINTVITCFFYSNAQTDNLVIETTHGKVRGATKAAATGKLVDMWGSIPFAKPPVGPLRFKHPHPVEPWDDIKDVDSLPNSCWQTMDTTNGDFIGSTMWNANTDLSEDCLYLTVTVPRPRPRHAAVMVWFFGGGFSTGSSTLDVYDPRILASEENVIVISIQYRLAALGFLYMGTEDAPGNAGMFDQIMALEWIRNNIHAFGGNPNNVTLFGESAGASAIAFHILSPLSRDMFNQAILQSGTPTAPWAIISKEESLKRGKELARNVGCTDDLVDISKVIDCLRETNASRLVYEEPAQDHVVAFTFVVVVDGTLIDQHPTQMIADSNNLKRMNLLLGSNAEEAFFFLSYFLPDMFPNNESVTLTRSQYLEAVDKVNKNLNWNRDLNLAGRQAVIFEYTNWLNQDDPKYNLDAVDKMVGDRQFVCGVNEFAQRFAEVGNSVYMYYFTHRSSIHPWPSWMGVLHADEINFVFGEPLNPEKGYNKDEVDFSKKIMRYWANFAKTGNPNKSPDSIYTRDYWPPYDPVKKEYIFLAPKNNTIGRGLRARQCAFWKKFLPQLMQITECSSSSTIYSNAQGYKLGGLLLSLLAIVPSFSFRL
ncbi:acetylcholinesterase-like [Artemia franciscana]|uniref:Carboxylic ester hydrolase n=1 Tax=Artemia franciscana TaxID=6661 RepID=A0AA88I1H0_ARTSF|nr:hypothetical protein QYM36_005217 [Artemia franciscana]